MIKAITVTNYIGESLTMELAKPENSGFIVKEITGLGPSKATISTTALATTDGAVFNGSRLEPRNIVLTLDMSLAADAEELRQLTYKYFPIKKYLTFGIETKERKLEAYGYVESNEPSIFSSGETAQISIVCPDPYFYSASGKNVTVFSGISPMFEFPFSNESLSENLLEMGAITHKQENTVVYTGDASVGVTITIHAIGDDVKNITIYNSRTREMMRVNTDLIKTMTGEAFRTGDDIIICTKRGMKSVTLLRAGTTTNILNALARDSSWFQLSKGDNMFAYDCEEGALNVQFKIENDVIYEGV